MKITILLTTLLLLGSSLTAQENASRKLVLGVSVSSTYDIWNGYVPLGITPSLTLSLPRHQLELGPRIPLRNFSYLNNSIGGDLIYKFYPIERKHVVSPFVMFFGEYYHQVYSDVFQSQYTQTYNVKAEERAVEEFLTASIAGGAQFNVNKYLNFSLYTGVGAWWMERERWVTIATTSHSHDKQFKFRNTRTLSLIFGVSVGCHFYRKAKK